MTSLTAIMADMLREIQLLDRRFHQPQDWGSRVQRLCEKIWIHIGVGKDRVSEEELDAFAAFFKKEDISMLARLVIPELRTTGSDANGEALSDQQRTIMTAAASALDSNQNATQEQFDHPLYSAEKHTFQDAELQRVRVLLQHTGRFNDVPEDEIKKWLKEGPKG